MDVSESNQELETLGRQHPEDPDESGTSTRRPRTRQVISTTSSSSSRHKSPTPRRCPSPSGRGPVATAASSSSALVAAPKRAVSAERRRPSTPPSPRTPSTPARDTSVDIESAPRKNLGTKLSESLWPSRRRSLSVSFQSDTVSLPVAPAVSKKDKEKPLSDRTSPNVAHKQPVTPTLASRKPTPERKRSPLKGRNGIDQSENSKPVDGLPSRLVDQHRWPSRANVKVSSDSLSKSLDVIPGIGSGMPSLRRMSIPDHTASRPLQKSASDAVRLLAPIIVHRRLESSDNPLKVPNPVSLTSSEKMTSLAPAARTLSLPSTPGSRPASPSKASVLSSRGMSPLPGTSGSRPASPSKASVLSSRGMSPLPGTSGSRPASPSKASVLSSRGMSPLPGTSGSRPDSPSKASVLTSRGMSSLPGTPVSRPASPSKASVLSSRGMSPSRTRASNCAPSRGVSPSRIRPSSPSRQSSNSNPTSVLTFTSDIRKGTKGTNNMEDVHHLRILYNRLVQWMFVNAQAKAVIESQNETIEKDLFNVWQATWELWNSVTEKKIDFHQLRLKLKLYMVLDKQMTYLQEWALIEGDQSFALSGAIEDLEASTLRLPVTGGAKVDIESLKSAVCSAVQVMQTIGSSVHSTLPSVEEMNSLVSELATLAGEGRVLLDECEALLASSAMLQVEEYSLRTHLIQSKQSLEEW